MLNLDDEKGQLGLKWKTFLQFAPGAMTGRVTSDAKAKSHTFLIDDHTSKHPDIRRPVVRQMVCRAALGERIDPIFATAYFESDEIDKKVATDVAFCAEMPLNFWADALRNRHWPDDTLSDNRESLLDIQRVLKQPGGVAMIDEMLEIKLVIGLTMAENETYKLGLGTEIHNSVFTALYPDTQARVKNIMKTLMELPNLSDDKNEAVAQLERATRQMLAVWELSEVEPYTVFSEELGCLSWRIPGHGDIV